MCVCVELEMPQKCASITSKVYNNIEPSHLNANMINKKNKYALKKFLLNRLEFACWSNKNNHGNDNDKNLIGFSGE